MTDDMRGAPPQTPETSEAPPEPPKVTRKRVSGADILSAIEGLGDKITSAIPSRDGGSGDDEAPEPPSALPPEVTFAPEEDPTPTPLATDAEATAPIPPVVIPGKRRGFPHRGRRGH